MIDPMLAKKSYVSMETLRVAVLRAVRDGMRQFKHIVKHVATCCGVHLLDRGYERRRFERRIDRVLQRLRKEGMLTFTRHGSDRPVGWYLEEKTP
jgi:hypothetical protein